MSTEKKYSHVKNKTFLIFFIICLAIISFPLIAIYSNTNLYLTSSNDFMKKVDKQFSQVIDNTKDTAIDKKILSNLHFEIYNATINADKAVENLKIEVIVIIGLSIFLILLLFSQLMRKLSKQFNLLINAYEEIANGNYSYRIDGKNLGSYRYLIKKFNLMAESLENRKPNIKSEPVKKDVDHVSETKLQDVAESVRLWEEDIDDVNLKNNCLEDDFIDESLSKNWSNNVQVEEIENRIEKFLIQQQDINMLLQQNLMFQAIPRYPELKIISKQDSIGIGGHYFFIPFENKKIGFLFIETSEPGMTANYLTNFIMIMSKQEFHNYPSVEKFINILNQKLYPFIKKLETKISAFCGIFDIINFNLSFVNAGFKAAIYFGTNGNGIQSLSQGNESLGSEIYYNEKNIKLNKGDKLFFYNRNVSIEAQNGLYSIRLSSNNRELVKKASFHDLSDKLSQIADNDTVEESFVLFELIESQNNEHKQLASYFDKGSQLFLEKDYKNALEIFNLVLQLDPTNLKALSNIGLIYYKLNEYRKAIEVWEKVLIIDPKIVKVKKNLLFLRSKIKEESKIV